MTYHNVTWFFIAANAISVVYLAYRIRKVK